MQKRTMLCLALTMTLVVAVKAQVHEDCLSLFSEAVGELASTDQACSTTLAQLTSETTECTDDVKKSIDECLDRNEALVTSFVAACETVTALSTLTTSPSPTDVTTPTTSPPDVSAISPTEELTVSSLDTPTAGLEPLMEPASIPSPEGYDWDWPMWQPAMTPEGDSSMESLEENPEVVPTSTPASSPENWSPEPSEDAEEPLDEEVSSTPAPTPARRLNRRLLSEALEEESDFVQLKRTLLQTANPTCRDLFIQGGAEAFHNNAASLKLSLLSIIGSILLGLMLI